MVLTNILLCILLLQVTSLSNVYEGNDVFVWLPTHINLIHGIYVAIHDYLVVIIIAT